MSLAARAIIIENGKILVMHRNKSGNEYFTLVGGRINDDETPEQGLVREVREETGMRVMAARLVYVEKHPTPYNEQYIYLCKVDPHEAVALQDDSEENTMNKYGMNMHRPQWASIQSFTHLSFRTPQLHAAIVQAFEKGFPTEPTPI
jgi:ADP-ribose pyrophosphatase YjhB (NUDIX family)